MLNLHRRWRLQGDPNPGNSAWPQIGGMGLINAAGAQINAGGIKKSHEHARPVYLSRSLGQLHLSVRVNAFHSYHNKQLPQRAAQGKPKAG